MNKKLQQINLDQTGMAIFILPSGEEKYIPLYSLVPIEEAHSIMKSANKDGLKYLKLKQVYFTNNLMNTRIEDTIEKYRENHCNLPEDYMEELISGFPCVLGGDEPNFKISYYK